MPPPRRFCCGPGKFSTVLPMTARPEVTVDVAEADIGVEPREVIGALFRARANISESWAKDRGWILAQRQIRAQSVEQNRAGGTEFQERSWRESQTHPGQLREGMVPSFFKLSQEDQHLRRSHPLADPGQQEWLGRADSDLIEGRRIVGEQQRVVVTGAPRQAVATDEQLDIVKRQLRIARRESGGAIVGVLEELGLEVEGQDV